MNRVIGVMASLILMISLSFVPISAQEPVRTAAPPPQTKGAPGGTTTTQPQPPAQAKAADAAKPKKDAPKTATDEEPVVTHHKILLGGKELPYTATAGLMPIRDAKDEVEARIFYIAYTRDDAGASTRGRCCSASTAGRARRRSGCTWGPWARDGWRRPRSR